MTPSNLRLGLLWLGAAGSSGLAATQSHVAPPSDFALHIEVGCGDTIDTSTETLRRITMNNGEVQATVPMTAARLLTLHQLVDVAHLFEYPAYYNPPFEGAFSVPYPQYKIRVQVAGRRHEIEWHAMRIVTPDAEFLAAFVREAYAVFRSEPAVQALPLGAPCL
jgi:hypothetical protein